MQVLVRGGVRRGLCCRSLFKWLLRSFCKETRYAIVCLHVHNAKHSGNKFRMCRDPNLPRSMFVSVSSHQQSISSSPSTQFICVAPKGTHHKTIVATEMLKPSISCAWVHGVNWGDKAQGHHERNNVQLHCVSQCGKYLCDRRNVGHPIA